MPYQDNLMNNHTCPLVIEYHECEKCKKITESRNSYKRFSDGTYRKRVQCIKCRHSFEVKKTLPPILG